MIDGRNSVLIASRNLGVGRIISEFVQPESLTFWKAGEEFDPITSFLERSKLGF